MIGCRVICIPANSFALSLLCIGFQDSSLQNTCLQAIYDEWLKGAASALGLSGYLMDADLPPADRNISNYTLGRVRVASHTLVVCT